MHTAIFVKQPNTSLTIHAPAELKLEKLGDEANPIKLKKGENSPIIVGEGVFKIQASPGQAVHVASATHPIVVSFHPNVKDDPEWPDPPKFVVAKPEAIRGFFPRTRSL